MQSFFDFIKEHPPVKRLQVNDLLLAEYQCPLNIESFDIWSHHNYFIYVLSGRKIWKTRDQEFLVRGGECLFVRKGAHRVYQFLDGRFCAIVLFVPDSFIRSVLLENRIKTIYNKDFQGRDALYSLNCGDELAAYFHSFYTYLKARETPSTSLMELKFKELIILSAVSGGCPKLNSYYSMLCHSQETSLKDLMEENFSFSMNLEEYARLCHRSLAAFKRDFKTVFGTTPGKWLIEKRLDYAKYLLENTDKPVLEVALDAGFKNHSHFSKVFKKEFGVSPQIMATKEK